MSFKNAGSDKNKLMLSIKEKWQELLGTNEDIAYDVSFFDVGGNSLTAGILFSEIEKQIGVKIGVSNIYTSDTISAVAQLIVDELKGREDLKNEQPV